MDKLIAMVREAVEEAKGMGVYVPKGNLPDLALKGIWYFEEARLKLRDALMALERGQALMKEAARQMAEKGEKGGGDGDPDRGV